MRHALARTTDRLPFWTTLPLILALVLAAGSARAQDDLIVSHGYSTFGDLRYGPDLAHLDYVNPDAPQGGEMSFSWNGGFDSVHPYTNQGRPAVLSSIFFESMLTGTADEIGSAYCLLCETLAYPEDRAFVIFTLRDGIAFSDGTPMTADDVLFSYEIMRDEGLPSFRANIPNTIAGAEVLDDRTIRFDFNPEAPIRGRVQSAGGLPVISRASHDASGLDFNEARLEPLIGSGPYTLGEVESGTRIVYDRNRDYWGDDLPINRGRNNFDSIRIEYYADGVAAFEGFTAGNYLFRRETSSVAWANNYDFPALERGVVVRAELPDGNIASGQSFVINLRQEKFADARVREAIALMFNFEWTNRTLFFGLYSPIDSFWENTHLEAEGMLDGAELAVLEPFRDRLRAEIFDAEPFATPPSNPERNFDRENATQAIALLEAAGYSSDPLPLMERFNAGAQTYGLVGLAVLGLAASGLLLTRRRIALGAVIAVAGIGVGAAGFLLSVDAPDGLMRDGNGQTLEVEFLNSSPLFDRIINPYVENLRAIGVDARLNRVDNAQLQERQREGDFDLITDHFPMGYEPSNGLRQYFGSIGADEALFNSPGLADPVIDELLEVVIRAETREEMETATRALDRVLRWERIRVPQWFNDSYWVAYYDIYRYPEPLPPYDLGFLDFWWIDPEAEAALRDEGEI